MKAENILGPEASVPFDPPFESPLETKFAWSIAKYLDSGIEFGKQFSVQTTIGRFRLDFVAKCGDSHIGFECDGVGYHDGFRDECRDAMILGEGHLSAIYRLRGKDIEYHIGDCLYLISQRDPQLFSVRGLTNLKILASSAARTSEWMSDTAYVEYEKIPFALIVTRRSQNETGDQPQHWKTLYEFARTEKVRSLTELVESRKALWKSES